MHSTTRRTALRLERAMRDRILPFIFTPLSSLKVEAWALAGEPIDPLIALGLTVDSDISPDFQPFEIGSWWGAAWDTTWFKFSGVAPNFPAHVDPQNPGVTVGAEVPGDDRTSRQEIVIDFGWQDRSVGFQCEGLVYRPDGSIVKALNPKNRWIPLQQIAEPGESFTFYVEAASNPLLLDVPPFQPTQHSAKPEVYEGALYQLRSADICYYNAPVAALASDLEVLSGLAEVIPDNTVRSERILMAIDRALNAVDTRNVPATAAAAREMLSPALALPANASAHQTSAMGHAHIDSAWLWPLRETERKVARTVSNVLHLLNEHEDLIFTMSSAQQYLWLEERYPELFARLKEQIAAGRVVPVGGMWVEPDGTMPSGESLARQVLLGQKYFKEKFGEYCDLMWLPDSFGYSGALPQIVSLGGMNRFLTQKISWNDTNVFPHHSFWWEGIDGTRILTHFPPSDTYGAEITAAELDLAVSNYRDKGISDNSILLFGYGDGGGGPTREMIARAHRFKDLEDASQVSMRGPKEFFDLLSVELEDSDSSWVGELYLELHRGTFTSQARTKAGNRRNEALIRQVEAACTRAALLGADYPREALTKIWQYLLLGQFHDILPGTSIKWVHDEAVEGYANVERQLRDLLERAEAHIAGAGGSEASRRSGDLAAPSASTVDGHHVLESEYLRVSFTQDGLVDSIVDKLRDREVVPSGEYLGQLAIYQDEPVMWDAWDIEKAAFDTEQIIDDTSALETADSYVKVEREFGGSRAELTYRFTPDGRGLELELDIDWHEEEKLLKLLFPLDLHANSARYETQFGFVERAIHENTSWDAARYEVVAHRYVHVLEGDYGVGLVNDSTYGYSVGKPTGSTVLIGASVLKSANFPDQEADRGQHLRRWALVPTASTAEVLDQAEEINELAPDHVGALVQVVDPRGATRVSAVKLADDGSGDVIFRLYEALGGRTDPKVVLGDAFGEVEVSEVDLLEEPLERTEFTVAGHELSVALKPFQIASFRISRK